jgi:hypothetical protein
VGVRKNREIGYEGGVPVHLSYPQGEEVHKMLHPRVLVRVVNRGKAAA